jgi:homopolymeric O-antigen transport system ATP-binding protein
MMSSPAISVNNLSKMYRLYDRPSDRLKESLHPFKKQYHRPFYALKQVSFEVKKGEILGVVGKNGAGKSTLLGIISGVLTPTSGQCRVQGRVSPLLSLVTGFNPELTGLENIYLNGTIKGYSKKEMNAKMEAILEFADIGEFIRQPLKVYSSGMRARLAFALAVNVDPEILIVDEVLAVGDDLFRRKCYARMEQLFQSGCTVLFVSHHAPQVIEICSRAILLDRGELMLDGPPLLVTRYYHKLLYASATNQAKVRTEIQELNRNEERKRDFARETDLLNEEEAQAEEAFRRDREGRDQAGQGEAVAYYIPDFVPKTTMRQLEDRVEIRDEQIQTQTGKKVNALVMNEVYVFSYKITLPEDMDDARFSTRIQAEKGQFISGFAFSQGEVISQPLARGETYLIQVRFKCTLLPGTYFISISAYTMNNKMEKAFLARVNDLAVFKVQGTKDSGYKGLVSLAQSGKILKLT